ncbi:MAG: DNA translocase FtsK 4TM domain-containing protein [Alphaproteobacteria bacterium]|nr:DNA translocase FtsK 4TM domain-containing protein [Alphaproteobacteria bacterium]
MAKSKKKNLTLLQKTLRSIIGCSLILFCVLVIISCFFYHTSDNSLNNTGTNEIKNYLGSFGAISAEFCLTWFGIALPIFLLTPISWGLDAIKLHGFPHKYARIFAFISGTIFFASFLSFLPQLFGNFKLGGNIGIFFAGQTNSLFNEFYTYAYGHWILATILFILSFLAFNFSAGLTLHRWYKLFCHTSKYIIISFCWLGQTLKSIFSFHSQEETLSRVSKNKAPKERKEPKLKEEKTAINHKKSSKPAKEEKLSVSVSAPDDNYQYPSVDILTKPKSGNTNKMNEKELEKIAADLENVLQEFGINGKIVKIRPGPVVTLYELEPAPGTKTARVIGLADDIARSMSAVSVRIAVVPGSNTIGIEMPNPVREIVFFRELIDTDEFNHAKGALTVTLGKDIGGRNVYADLAKMPHLLVAGTTGSGKSVGVNTMIVSLLYKMRPDECKLIMIDPKMLEFSVYNGIPHLLTPVITDPAKAVIGLKWAVKEMEDRYRAMAQLNVRNISGYNQKLKELKANGQKVTRTVQTGFDTETGQPIFEEQELDLTPLPYIVIIVDEMADLMLVAGKEVEAAIQRLAQMARAAGLHLIMSTQRPSVDVITGTIKANFPTRISFQVTSKIDSRTILGEQGAEQLLGMGDMLYMPAGQRPTRIHAGYIKDPEIEEIVEFLKSQKAPEYVEGVTEGELNEKDSGSAVFDKGDFASGSDEDLYSQAVAIVQNDKKASTSYIQRKLRIGYNRAASLIDKMEAEGIISAADHVGRREVL